MMRLKPRGWKRLTESEIVYYLPAFLQSEKVWAWRKGYNIVGVLRYFCEGISKSNYGYDVFYYNIASKKDKFLDEVYSYNSAISLAYYYMKLINNR